MGNYRPFLQGPLPVANYTRIIIPGRFWTRPPSTKSTRMASSATPLHDSLIELAIPDAHAHAIKWYLKGGVSVGSVSARPIHSLEEQLSKFPAQLLDSPCADAHLVKLTLSQSIAELRDLSPYHLRLSPSEERGILTALPPATPARQRIDMLRTWRDKFGLDATYR